MSKYNFNVFCIDSIIINVQAKFEQCIFNGFSGLRANGAQRTQSDAVSRSTCGRKN